MQTEDITISSDEKADGTLPKQDSDATPQPGVVESHKDAAPLKGHDIAENLYHEINDYTPEELEAERKAVLRMIDWRIMPMICFTYTIQFLDKLSLNYASAYTLIDDLGLGGQRYNWVAAIFNFGYLFWALPANMLLQRLPVAKYTGCMICVWAILLIGHVGATNYGGILVLRFLLGMLEASISPAIMSICSMFYTRDEQPLRMCVFLAFNGFATMVGALLGFGLGHATNSALKSWQLIFLTIGLINFVWSLVFIWVVPDSPTTAKFLTHKQRVIAVQRVAVNMIGVKTPQFKPAQAIEAFLDVKIIVCGLVGLACGIINGGVSNFASALIKGYGFSGINTTLLQLPTGAFELFLVPVCGLVTTFIKDTRCVMLAVICLPPLAGLIGIRFTSLDKQWTLVGCTWLQYLVGAPVVISWNLLTTNIAGHTKRTFGNGIWFILYAAGNIIGANIFFSQEAPRYQSAILALCVSYGGIIVLAAFLGFYMMYENRRRSRLIDGENEGTASQPNLLATQQAVDDGFRDLTDKENRFFRYAL